MNITKILEVALVVIRAALEIITLAAEWCERIEEVSSE
jgi:hypothetical protein